MVSIARVAGPRGENFWVVGKGNYQQNPIRSFEIYLTCPLMSYVDRSGFIHKNVVDLNKKLWIFFYVNERLDKVILVDWIDRKVVFKWT